MRLKLLFFAALRDAAQTAERSFTVQAETLSVDALLRELRVDLPEIDRPDVRVAVNHEFVSRDHQISDGDEIAFIPPVAGG